jgi:cytochrome o ubiquinol oxidase subunit 1
MGATRRLNTYDASLGWQWLFIVAGVGVLIIALAIGLQLLQVGYSVFKRKDTRDSTGDPWDGRTLEWSTPSPVPVYNFAIIPQVSSRDQFWVDKKQPKSASTAKPMYSAIMLPKNTGFGLAIAAFAFTFGFAAIWHLAWLALLAILGIVACLIIRSLQEETEYYISAAEVLEIETKARTRKATA